MKNTKLTGLMGAAVSDVDLASPVSAGFSVAPRSAVRVRVKGPVRMTRGDSQSDIEQHHPAVITDPVSCAKALIVNPIYTKGLSGVSEAESARIFAALFRHATKPDFSCRPKWGTGDLAIWDNRMSLHCANNDNDGVRRLFYRTSWQGEPPA